MLWNSGINMNRIMLLVVVILGEGGDAVVVVPKFTSWNQALKWLKIEEQKNKIFAPFSFFKADIFRKIIAKMWN